MSSPGPLPVKFADCEHLGTCHGDCQFWYFARAWARPLQRRILQTRRAPSPCVYCACTCVNTLFCERAPPFRISHEGEGAIFLGRVIAPCFTILLMNTGTTPKLPPELGEISEISTMSKSFHGRLRHREGQPSIGSHRHCAIRVSGTRIQKKAFEKIWRIKNSIANVLWKSSRANLKCPESRRA